MSLNSNSRCVGQSVMLSLHETRPFMLAVYFLSSGILLINLSYENSLRTLLVNELCSCEVTFKDASDARLEEIFKMVRSSQRRHRDSPHFFLWLIYP